MNDMKDWMKKTVEAVSALLNVCDGAKREDGRGFNKFDSIAVNSIISKDMSELRAYRLLKILKKYRIQLINNSGIDYFAIYESIPTADIKRLDGELTAGKEAKEHYKKGSGSVHVWLEDGRIAVETPYNKDFVQDIRTLKGNPDANPFFDGNRKIWLFKVKCFESLYSMIKDNFPEADESIFPEITDELLNQPIGKITYAGTELFFCKTEYCPELISEIKAFPRRTWNPSNKVWEVSITTSADFSKLWQMANDYNIIISGKAQEAIDTLAEKYNTSKKASHKSTSDIEIPIKKGMSFYPFQKAAIEFFKMHNFRAITGDEMGLGKTAQGLGAYFLIRKENTEAKALIIVPATLKINWKREIQKFAPENFRVFIIGAKSENTGMSIDTADIVICNYNRLTKMQQELQQFGADLLIFDEFHKIKNPKAKRTKVALELANTAKHVLFLSGTPMLNRPRELYTALTVLDKQYDTKDGYWNYHTRYCDAQKTRYGWDMNGSSNREELQTLLRERFMVRRLKSEVLKELPAKTRQHLYLEMSSDIQKTYNESFKGFKDFVKRNYGKTDKITFRVDDISQLTKLRHLTGLGKVESAVNWIQEFIEKTNSKLVVFAHHKDVVKGVVDGCNAVGLKSVWFDGSKTGDARQKAIDDFQNDESVKVIVMTSAGSEGITLTAAYNMLVLEMCWTPGLQLQQEDRIHRIGQENACNVYYGCAQGTIDEVFAAMLSTKCKVIEECLDDAEKQELKSSHVMLDLIQSILGGEM